MAHNDSDRFAALETRLSELERANRRLRILAMTPLLAGVVVLAGWQGIQKTPPKGQAPIQGELTVAAPDRFKRIELIDDAGRPLMKLSAKGIEIRGHSAGDAFVSVSSTGFAAMGPQGKSETRLDFGELMIRDHEKGNVLACTIDRGSAFRQGAFWLGKGPIQNAMLYRNRDGLGKLILSTNVGAIKTNLPPN